MNRDTVNLRDSANFEVEVSKNVFWVPANSLGHTQYTDEEIKSLLSLEPNKKKQKINNLYEAIQLFQASEFKGVIDNVRVLEEDTHVLWVYHKNGFDSVRTNEGCCAADSNWLSYILEDRYDEIGCFGFCQADGNGHITNYIKNGEWFYFLDMMMQRYDSVKDTAVETGNIVEYKNNFPFHTAYIHKAKCFDGYIKYFLCKNENAPVIFYKTKNSECVCVGNEYFWEENKNINGWNLVQKSNKFLFYEDTVEILFAKNNDDYELRKSKAVEPNWSKIKSFDFDTLTK